MSRVHDALRRATQSGGSNLDAPVVPGTECGRPPPHPRLSISRKLPPTIISAEMLRAAPEVPFQPAPESHLLDLMRTHETPAEEFRTLRTRLNHLQSLQPLHTVVVTSASPAEGKTFTAVNLALAESHLPDRQVLLADFDLRRPHDAQPLPDRPRPRLDRFPAGPDSSLRGPPEGHRHEPVPTARRISSQQPARTAQQPQRPTAVRTASAGSSTGASSIARRCCSPRTPTCSPPWPTAPSWW